MDNQTKKSKISFFTKEYWKTLSWKQILINLAVYLAIYGIMILIDLLTKSKIYDNSANSGIKIEHYQGKIIGTRSVLLLQLFLVLFLLLFCLEKWMVYL